MSAVLELPGLHRSANGCGFSAMFMHNNFRLNVAGVQTQPACLAFANNLTKSENTNIAYAGIYPAAMIVKIILAQLLV